MRKYLSKAILIIVVLIYSFFTFMTYSKKKDKLVKQEAKITELNKKLKETNPNSAIESSDVKDNVKALTGFDANKYNSDNIVAKKAFKELFTWTNFKEYNKVRDIAINKYKLDKNGQFLTEYMPVVETYKKGGYKGSKGDGKLYNYIDDNGINTSFIKFEPFLYEINGKEYHYLSKVSLRIKDMAGNNTVGNVIVDYKIIDKNISDVSVFYLNDY